MDYDMSEIDWDYQECLRFIDEELQSTIAQQPLSGSGETPSPKSYSPFEDSIEYHDSVGE